MTEAEQKKKEKQESALMTGTVIVSIVFAVAIFMVLPYLLSGLLKRWIPSYGVRTVIEGLVRIGIFILLYTADFPHGRYSAYFYVPWCGAQMY